MRVIDKRLVRRKPRPGIKALRAASKAREAALLENLQRPARFTRPGLSAPGDLCWVRKCVKERFSFSFCTVLRNVADAAGRVEAVEVVTPEGQLVRMDPLWLRPVEVQNGNVDGPEEMCEKS